MSPSICARVALNVANAAALPRTASLPWLASRWLSTRRFEAEVLAPPRAEAFHVP